MIEHFRADILVIDTFGNVAQFSDGQEQDSGPVGSRLRDLAQLADVTGVAIIVVHHARKGAKGDPIQDARGSNAFSATCDMLVSVVPLRDGKRRLCFKGRKYNGSLLIRLTDAGLEELDADEPGPARTRKTGRKTLELPDNATEAMTRVELAKRQRWTVSRVRRYLDKLSGVCWIGEGVKGEPRRFYKPLAN